MSDSPTVKIMVNEITVKGNVAHRSEAYILVEITEPFEGLSTGLSIPYFSRPMNSFESEYGDRTAENLLKYLYELGAFIRDNRSVIRAQMAVHFFNEDYSDEISRDRFFGSTFPCIVPRDTRAEVMSIILAMESQERGKAKKEYIPIRKLRPYYTSEDRWAMKEEIKTSFTKLRNQLAKYFVVWKQVGGGTTGYAIGSVRHQLQRAEKLFKSKC